MMSKIGTYTCFDEKWVRENYANYERNTDLWKAYLETHDCKYSANSFKAYLIQLGLRREWTQEMTDFLAPHYPEWGAKRSQEEIKKKFGVLKSINCIHHNMSENGIRVTKEARSRINFEKCTTNVPIGTIHFHKSNPSRGGGLLYTMIKTEDGWKPYGSYINANTDKNLVAIPLDMNQQNLDPENWILVPKKLIGTMGKLNLWSTDPEVNKIGLKLCELIQAISKQQKYAQRRVTT